MLSCLGQKSLVQQYLIKIGEHAIAKMLTKSTNYFSLSTKPLFMKRDALARSFMTRLPHRMLLPNPLVHSRAYSAGILHMIIGYQACSWRKSTIKACYTLVCRACRLSFGKAISAVISALLVYPSSSHTVKQPHAPAALCYELSELDQETTDGGNLSCSGRFRHVAGHHQRVHSKGARRSVGLLSSHPNS